MKQCLILQGLPGSGKSTFAQYIKKNNLYVTICSADDYHVVNGVYKYEPSKAGTAHSRCMEKFLSATSREAYEDCLLTEATPIVVVDNTNTQLWEMYPYISVAKARGWEVEVHTFKCDVETSMNRNIHGVPKAVIERMYMQLTWPLTFWPCEHIIHD